MFWPGFPRKQSLHNFSDCALSPNPPSLLPAKREPFSPKLSGGVEVWREKGAPLSWIKCISPCREETGLQVPEFPSHLCPHTAHSSAVPGAATGSGGGGAAGRGQKRHCHCSAGAQGSLPGSGGKRRSKGQCLG